MARVATIDFETESIKDFDTDKAYPRPIYPPVPVGCAVRRPGRKTRYLAWGHPTGNNCTKEQATAQLADVWRDYELSGWNMKFDLDVAETRLGLAPPPHGFRDVQFKAFLDDPNQRELSLKPTADRVLGLPPDERDAVREWIFANVPEMKGQPKTSRKWAGFICRAPGKLVAPYAIGDVDRTDALDVHYDHDVLGVRDMREAYEREIALLPFLLEMERARVPVDEVALRRDLARWQKWEALTDAWLRRRLRSDNLNLDSNDDLADALEDVGAVTEWILTEPSKRFPNGQRSTARENLMQVIADPALREVLTYRAKLVACVRMIGVPWVAMMDAAGEPSICTTWNQTKDYAEQHSTGARTGRLSSQPNFQNIPTTEPHDKTRGEACPCPACGLKRIPDALRRAVGALPAIRQYVRPPKGFAFINRDYCFSDDTEVLTEHGWRLFSALDRTERLAQCENEIITYVLPLKYQAKKYVGEMVSIVGGHSTDLLVTPDHMCVVENARHEVRRVRADVFPLGQRYQRHAGMLGGASECVSEAVRTLVAAVQADARVYNAAVVWSMRKLRKRRRLLCALKTLGIKRTSKCRSTKPGFRPDIRVSRADVEWAVVGWLDLSGSTHGQIGKRFTRRWLSARGDDRRQFLRELGYWDGHRQSKTSWKYFTTNAHNAALVQELCAVSGFRAGMRTTATAKGKSFFIVNMRENPRTMTDRFVLGSCAYSGTVYCVTMPAGTVIVRRNGKVSVTGQCQQEFRILADYEGGPLMRAYLADPALDVHDLACELVNRRLCKHFNRRSIKAIGLGLIYGMGKEKLAISAGVDVATSQTIKRAYFGEFPGLPDLSEKLKARARNDEPIRTAGGREYRCEPPTVNKKTGRVQTYEYKMLNTLIQGSAADQIKEAMRRYKEHPKRRGRLLLSVHDELLGMCPARAVKEEDEVLRECMESVAYCVPMLTDGDYGEKSWGDLKG